MGRIRGQKRNSSDITLLSAEVCGGQTYQGTEEAPRAILSLISAIPEWSWTHRERSAQWKDLSIHSERVSESALYSLPEEMAPPPPYTTLGRTLEALSRSVSNALRRDEKVLCLGGDHSVAIGSIAGALNTFGDDLIVLWIDAHGDFNTIELSPSGNVHGMPLAALCGEFGFQGPEWAWLRGSLKGSQVIHAGGRSFDQGERERMNHRGIQVVDMDKLKSLSVKRLGSQVRESLSRNPRKKLWVSLDIDALSDIYTPGTGTPEPNGLEPSDSLSLIADLTSQRQCIGFELVEFNPKLDTAKKETAALVLELAIEALEGFRSSIVGTNTLPRRTG